MISYQKKLPVEECDNNSAIKPSTYNLSYPQNVAQNLWSDKPMTVTIEIHTKRGSPCKMFTGGTGTRGWIAKRPRIEPNTIGKKINETIPNDTQFF